MEKEDILDQTPSGKMTDTIQLSTVILTDMIISISLIKNTKISLEVQLEQQHKKNKNTTDLDYLMAHPKLYKI